MGDGPEKQQYGTCAQQCRHGIDGESHMLRVRSEINEKPCRKHEDRIARWMTDFKFITLRYELRTVPETCRGLQSEKISDRRDDKHEPSERVIEYAIFFHHLDYKLIQISM